MISNTKAGGDGTNTLHPQTQNHHHTSGLPTYLQLDVSFEDNYSFPTVEFSIVICNVKQTCT